ncbi:hypothetical protein Bbelb_364030 [Branchiostoma belcheri]|nr:hypothetical protein Bbelb_364030 [Branchiostoma belcheri]
MRGRPLVDCQLAGFGVYEWHLGRPPRALGTSLVPPSMRGYRSYRVGAATHDTDDPSFDQVPSNRSRAAKHATEDVSIHLLPPTRVCAATHITDVSFETIPSTLVGAALHVTDIVSLYRSPSSGTVLPRMLRHVVTDIVSLYRSPSSRDCAATHVTDIVSLYRSPSSRDCAAPHVTDIVSFPRSPSTRDCAAPHVTDIVSLYRSPSTRDCASPHVTDIEPVNRDCAAPHVTDIVSLYRSPSTRDCASPHVTDIEPVNRDCAAPHVTDIVSFHRSLSTRDCAATHVTRNASLDRITSDRDCAAPHVTDDVSFVTSPSSWGCDTTVTDHACVDTIPSNPGCAPAHVTANNARAKTPVTEFSLLKAPGRLSESAPRDLSLYRLWHDRVRQSGRPNFQGERIPVPTGLIVAAWRRLLHTYTDTRLCDLVEFGFPVNYVSTSPPVVPRTNHPSALQYASNVDKYLTDTSDLILIYIGFVRPVLEYACVIWHPGLTRELSQKIERVQKRSLRVILGSEYDCYHTALDTTGLSRLDTRRDELCLRFARSLTSSIGPTAGRIARRPQAGGRSDSREGRDRGRCGIHPMEAFDNGFRTGPYRNVRPGPEPVIERYRGPEWDRTKSRAATP